MRICGPAARHTVPGRSRFARHAGHGTRHTRIYCNIVAQAWRQRNGKTYKPEKFYALGCTFVRSRRRVEESIGSCRKLVLHGTKATYDKAIYLVHF